MAAMATLGPVVGNATDDVARKCWYNLDGRDPTLRVMMSEVLANSGDLTYEELKTRVYDLHQLYLNRPVRYYVTWHKAWERARRLNEVEVSRHIPGKFPGDLVPLYRWRGMPVRNYGIIIADAVKDLDFGGGASASDVHHMLEVNYSPVDNPPNAVVILTVLRAMETLGTMIRVSRLTETPRFSCI